jgi:Kdo2-lipid IVA lauroyltransferase/acyltransferase
LARLILARAWRDRASRHAWSRVLVFRLEWLIVACCWYVFRALSPERAARLGRFVVGVSGPRSSKAPLVEANLAIALPALSRTAVASLAYRSWRNLGLTFGEYPHLDRIATSDRPPRLSTVAHCDLEPYRHRSRAAIFFGAHLSNWEVMALALTREGIPLLVVQAALQNPYLDELMNRARRQLKCGLLSRQSMTSGRGSTVRRLVGHISTGGSLGMLLDLNVQDGTEMAFFGHPMGTSTTAARLAVQYGCDLVPIRTERVAPACFRVTVDRPIVCGTVERRRASTIEVTRRINAQLEDWIRERPDEWMCAKRHWPKEVYRSLGFGAAVITKRSKR